MITILIYLLATTLLFQRFSTGFHLSECTLSLFTSVAIIDIIKAVRLLFIMHGSKLDTRHYFEIYCESTLVNVVLPYKLGEFFRMYCYGKEIKNFTKSAIIVSLDRFMDTAALCTMMLFWWEIKDGEILIFIMLSVLFFLTMLYFAFPGNYQFWRKYLLEAKASERRIYMLKNLKALQDLYTEVQAILKGRGFILYFLSLLAWIIEVGGMQKNGVTQYLTSIVNGPSSNFVLISVIELLLAYAILKLIPCRRKAGESKNEDIHNI